MAFQTVVSAVAQLCNCLGRAALEAALREMGSLNAQYAMRHVQVVSETLHSYSENSITRKG